jgi:hypothetical protein
MAGLGSAFISISKMQSWRDGCKSWMSQRFRNISEEDSYAKDHDPQMVSQRK